MDQPNKSSGTDPIFKIFGHVTAFFASYPDLQELPFKYSKLDINKSASNLSLAAHYTSKDPALQRQWIDGNITGKRTMPVRALLCYLSWWTTGEVDNKKLIDKKYQVKRPQLASQADVLHYLGLGRQDILEDIQHASEFQRLIKDLPAGPLSEFWTSPHFLRVSASLLPEPIPFIPANKPPTPQELSDYYESQADENRKRFRWLGAFPHLKAWEILAFQSLWMCSREDAEYHLSWLEKTGIISRNADKSWAIPHPVLHFARQKLDAYPTENDEASGWLERLIMSKDFEKEYKAFKAGVRALSIWEIYTHENYRLSIPTTNWFSGAWKFFITRGAFVTDWEIIRENAADFTTLLFAIGYKIKNETRASFKNLLLWISLFFGIAVPLFATMANRLVGGIAYFLFGGLSCLLLVLISARWRERMWTRLWQAARGV